MQKILIVEDDEKLRNELEIFLNKNGYITTSLKKFDNTVEDILKEEANLILLDINLPFLDGEYVLKEIRKVSEIPVIMVTSRDSELDELLSMNYGADDYVTKPFSPKEVMARIHAVLKRGAQETQNDVVTFEGLTIDMLGRNVYVDGEKAELTPKEYEILFYFVKNKGIALTREKLLMDVWGFDFYGDDRTVDTHIKMLRSNLKQYRKFIVTLRGLGYKFEV